jgi:ABC-type transport system involved in cytochrome c biogenesis permease subunit
MNCAKCHSSLPEGKMFCPQCGHLNESNKDSYSSNKHKTVAQFTSQHKAFGYILFSALAVIFLGVHYYELFRTPLVPALQNKLIYVHVPLGFVSYAAIIAALILSVRASFDSLGIPKVVLKLQFIAVVLFTLCVLVGSIWAKSAWGIYWHWEPKLLTSFIVLGIMLASSFIITLVIPNIKGAIAVLSVEFISVVYLYWDSFIHAGLHAYNPFLWR